MPPFNSFASRVNAQVTPLQQRARSGGIGDAVSLLGRAAGQIADQDAQTDERVADIDHRIAMREQGRDDDAVKIQGGLRLAQAKKELNAFELENQNAVDYEQRYSAEVDRQLGEVKAVIGYNPRVSADFAIPLAEFDAREKSAAGVQAMQVRAKEQAAGVNATLETLRNTILTRPDDATAELAELVMETQIGKLQAIPDALKPAKLREAKADIRETQFNALIDQGRQEDVATRLASGKYDDILSPESKARLLNNVAVQRRAAQSAADAQVTVAEEGLTEGIAALKTRNDGGEDVSLADIDAYRAVATRLNKPDAQAKLDVLRTEVAVERQFRDASPIAIRGTIKDLETKRSRGRATPEQQRMIKRLKHIETRNIENDAKPRKEEYNSGVAGRLSVADQLQTIASPIERARRAEAVHKGFASIATLPRAQERAMAIQGQEDLPAVEKHFGGNMQARFDAVTGRAAREFSTQDELATAKALYAFKARRGGVDRFDAKLWAESVREAFGGHQEGGVWRGGIDVYNRAKVILPPNRSAGEFRAFADAHDFSAARIAGDRPISKAQALGNFRPVYVGMSEDGAWAQYKWVGPDGKPLGRKGGGIYQMNVRN